MTTFTPATSEELITEIEFRVSALYVRTADAHAVHPVDPADVHDEWSRRIIAAAYKVVDAKLPVTPQNIMEFGHIPEEQIDKRLNDWKAKWLLDMADNYIPRIQAEGLRTRGRLALKEAYDDLNVAPWRGVETTHAQNAQKISSVQIGGVGDGDDDAGFIFEHITDKPPEEYAPMAGPWPWFNDSIGGGLFPFRKYVFAAPFGQRKTTSLFMFMHYMVMIQKKIWAHFPFDGGAVSEQILNFFVVHWAHLLMHHSPPIPMECKAKARVGGVDAGTVDNYCYVNTTVALKLLYGHETNVLFPPGALDMFNQARTDMRALQQGRGPGLLVMVSRKTVGGDVYKVAQRLRNEQYGRDGLDGFSLDHMGLPSNRYSEDQQRMPENTRVLCDYTDTEGPPCILISQLSGEGVQKVGKGTDIDPHLRYNPELSQNADGVFMFQYDGTTPNVLTLINQKNRKGSGGPGIRHMLRIQPVAGYIWDDPKWASGGPSNITRRPSRATRSQVKSRDEEDMDEDGEED